jgi:hypothetical protein
MTETDASKPKKKINKKCSATTITGTHTMM